MLAAISVLHAGAYRLLADAVVLAHLGFVLFVTLGALLVLRWPRLAWLHLPAAAWGVWVEYSGWICPLTPLEQHWRRLAGEPVYGGDFVQHYVTSLLYPATLTRRAQVLLGTGVLLLNVLLYLLVLRHHRPTGPARTRRAGHG